MPLLRHLRIGKARRDDQSGSSPGQTPSSRVGGSTATQTKPTLESRPDAAQPPDSQVKGQGDTRSTTGSTFGTHAETTLKEAAEKLQKKLPEEVQQDERFRINPIHGSGTPPSPPNFVLPTPAATGLVFPGVEPVPVDGAPIPPPPPVALRKYIPN